MFGFLKPAPDAEQKISEEKVPRLYKMWQTRVLISTAIVYIGYYIIRYVWDWLWNFKADYGNIS